MTTDDPRLAEVLRIYAEHPLAAGDVVLLLDGLVCLELPGLADEWDDELRHSTSHVLRETAGVVVLAVARPGAGLLPQDHRLWRELHDELRGSQVELAPARALPAA